MLILILEYLERLLVTLLVIAVLIGIALYNSLDKRHFLSFRRWGKAEDAVLPWLDALREELTFLLPSCSPLHRTQAEELLAQMEQYPRLAKDYQRCQCCAQIIADSRPILSLYVDLENDTCARLDQTRTEQEAALTEALERYNEAAGQFASKASYKIYRPFVRLYRGKTYPPVQFPSEN